MMISSHRYDSFLDKKQVLKLIVKTHLTLDIFMLVVFSMAAGFSQVTLIVKRSTRNNTSTYQMYYEC